MNRYYVKLLTVSLLFFTTVNSQQLFTLKGDLPGLKEAHKIFLSYNNGEKYIRDSAIIANGKFNFKGKLQNPAMAELYTQEINYVSRFPKREFLSIYLENGVISVTGYNSLKAADVKGGLVQAEYQRLLKNKESLTKVAENIIPLLRNSEINDSLKASLGSALQKINSKLRLVENEFIKSHPASRVSWDIVYDRGIIINADELLPVFNMLSQEFRETKKGIALKERIDKVMRLKLGNPAIEFVINDANGKPISLSSFKGKYVLIDFWASWCGPCRAENPNMLRAYTSLKEKNFEILGVSLDDNREKWLKAVAEDKLPWVQVSDLKGFETIAKTYDINAIPQNFLLDTEGKIIAKNIRGESMESIIRKYMGL